MAMTVDSNTCCGCGACVDECPREAIDVPEDVAVIDADECVDCGACLDSCPTESILEAS